MVLNTQQTTEEIGVAKDCSMNRSGFMPSPEAATKSADRMITLQLTYPGCSSQEQAASKSLLHIQS